MNLVETEYNNGHIAEIGQTLDVKFAWAKRKRNGDYTNNMPFVKCRDFLGDSLWAEETGQTKSIYGFSFNPKKQKINKKNTALILKFPNPEILKTFTENFFIHLPQYDGLACGTVSSIDYGLDWKETNLLLIKADPLWRKSIIGISAFTFLLKCLSYKLDHNKGLLEQIKEMKVEKTDWDGTKRYVPVTEAAYVVPEFELLLQNLREITKKLTTVTGLPGETSIHTVHNWSGFVAACKHKRGEVSHYLQELQNANPQ